jgi:hypothetical protein
MIRKKRRDERAGPLTSPFFTFFPAGWVWKPGHPHRGRGVVDNESNKRLTLGLYNAVNRANRDALRRVIVTDAFHARRRIDDINAVAFSDGGGGAFRFTSSARNALFCNFHCHGWYLLYNF